MEFAPLTINTPQEPESLTIEQDKKKYILNIIKEDNYIILIILEKDIFPNIKYIKKLSFKEIKELHKIFSILNSCNEFSDYIKSALENKKINIKKENEKMIFNISVEYLFKTQIIEIPLLKHKIDYNHLSKEICKELLLLKEKIKKLENNSNDKKENNIELILDKQNKEIIELKEDNKKLKKEINEIKSIIDKQNNENKKLEEEIKIITQRYKELKENINTKQKQENKENIKISEKININSVIMKNEEFDMIKNAIENRINKKVKEVRKLYQATIDGSEANNFHSKCDNIPNTLTIIKSAGNRRFGGFTSNTWESTLIYKDDKNAFLFSLDKNKIYNYKNDECAIFCWRDNGPSFGCNNSFYNTIGIDGNPIKNNVLSTYESDSNSFEFNGDNNALSEDGKGNNIYAKDYEVFEILLY